jgi:hypothetical protein
MLLVGLAVWLVNRAMHDFFHGVFAGNGPFPVTAAKDWPKPLTELVKDAEHEKISVQNLNVECMCRGYETEYIWRMQSTPGLSDFLKKRWKLSPTPVPDHGIFLGKSMISGDKTPEWWSPMVGKNSQFFVCGRTVAMEYGDQFQVAIDNERELIFVRYYEKW